MGLAEDVLELQSKQRQLEQQLADLQARAAQGLSLSSTHGGRHIDGNDPLWGVTTANFVLAAPNGSAGGPQFRLLATGDMPARTATIAATAQGGSPTTTSGCAEPVKVEAGTNDVDYWVMDFDAATQEYGFWVLPLPDGYDGGTFTAIFYWTTAASSGNVIWGIQLASRADDEAIDQAYGTAIEVTDGFLAAGDVHKSAATSAITAAGTPAGGEELYIRVYRKAADGGDTLNGDARLKSVRIEFGTAYSD